MRRTWDALAGAENAVYVGDPARGAEELAGLFARLGADPGGGFCVEVGCGPGRMTGELAEHLDGVADGVADTLVCYLVLQHLPSRRVIVSYLEEFARVLAPRGEAFVQLPVLGGIAGR